VSDAHLDHPGDISWFKGYGPVRIIRACPHDLCPHNAISDIAWGPDYEHYTLVTCDVPEGCDGFCRAWSPEYPHNDPRRRYGKAGPFLMTDTSERVLADQAQQ
jgi:hypothetical protein